MSPHERARRAASGSRRGDSPERDVLHDGADRQFLTAGLTESADVAIAAVQLPALYLVLIVNSVY